VPERFFIDGAVDAGSGMAVAGALAHHLARSLRLRPGDTIVAVDGSGREHGVRLRTVTAALVEGDLTWSREATGEPRLRVTVVQALPRERMEDCIDVLVEAGAVEIRPVRTERAVSRPPDDRVAPRLRRWQAIATESAQLSGRGIIPLVHAPTSLADGLAALTAGARVIACTFESSTSMATLEVDSSRPLALCIGPEGGFGEADLESLRAAGAELVHLGPRVLRTRYAGAVATALLLARAGDLDAPVTAEPMA
jgi:16S rRNA (uracil1498-N3)-methyltransferase